MKASELIELLEDKIKEYGDCEVRCRGYGDSYEGREIEFVGYSGYALIVHPYY